MAKEVTGIIKLQIPAGQANPAPPVGPALGQQGVNIMAFCKEFNAATQKQAGDILPVVITVYKDKSFTFITKSPPSSILLKKAANIASGSKEPNKIKVGKLSKKQVADIAKVKMKDLNARSDEAAFRIIAGTARQMGIEIEPRGKAAELNSKFEGFVGPGGRVQRSLAGGRAEKPELMLGHPIQKLVSIFEFPPHPPYCPARTTASTVPSNSLALYGFGAMPAMP